MTNTLHRYGDVASFHDDFIFIAIPSRGHNDQDCVPKLQQFLRMALSFGPVNLGDARTGGALQPSKSMNPACHWIRDNELNFEGVISGIAAPATVAAVFDDPVKAENFAKAVVEADLGLSVNISTSIEGAEDCCEAAAVCRHSVGYSLGFMDDGDQLPSRDLLQISTMCGHGMISTSLTRKMIDWVKEGRRTPDQAANYLQRFCSCGIFNPSRASRIIASAAKGAR
jgi:hypothetical protein